LPRRLIESCVELAVRQKAISQLKNDEALMDTDNDNQFAWMDMNGRDGCAQGNLLGVQQQAVLEDMMLRVFEELQDIKNMLLTSGTSQVLPRTLSRTESRRLHIPRNASGGIDRTSRFVDEVACEVQGAHCVLRRLRD
jgi:hypothetical protein